ncbi:hypothetical protein V8E52_007472 [Russula decolorans]
MTKATPSAPSALRPKCTIHASSKFINPANIADAELRSHKDAINARWMAEAAVAKASDITGSTSESSRLDNRSSPATPTTVFSSSEPPTTAKRANPTTDVDSVSDNDHDLFFGSKKSRHSIVIDESDEEDSEKGIRCVSQASPERDLQTLILHQMAKTYLADLKPLMKTAFLSMWMFSQSLIPPPANKKSPQHQVSLVADVTTCRRHMESYHKRAYLKWATENEFQSMLPKDAKNRRQATMKDTQQRLDPHLEEKPPRERVIPYTDDLFREAAIEWLVSNDQMIHITARATNGVKISNGRQTRQAIIDTFKAQLTALRRRLTSDTVKGKASNIDSYFAVTGSWVENVNGHWELRTALLGFTQLNNIIARLGIAHKIGHITCDNASNNNTMLKEFAKHVCAETGWIFNPETDRIRCLAHIINLAMQALISTHSKSKHYNPAEPDADFTVGNGRDVACSSAKRKQLFADLQHHRNMKPIHQLLIDMPVRWSSTYIMTSRTESMGGIINTFVYEIGRDEKDLGKREKIDNLRLDAAEGDELKLFNDLLVGV